MRNVSLSTLANVPGVMTGREFERRAQAWATPLLTAQADAEAERWDGINVAFRGGRFVVQHGWTVKPALKAAGFKWNNYSRTWETDSPHVVARCPELLRKSKGITRDALRSVLRLQAAEATFARAADRLEPGDVERIKVVLKEPMLTALREAMDILAEFDTDKATIRNKEGFSKADTELGHTLVLVGITKFLHATLARKLAWKYRAQLPADVLSGVFPFTSSEEPAPTPEPAPLPALTLTEAYELVAYPTVADLLDDLHQTPYAITDGTPEPDVRALPPFMRETRAPVARIEGGAVLLLVTRSKLPVRLEVRLAG